jgi:hypothetical protein
LCQLVAKQDEEDKAVTELFKDIIGPKPTPKKQESLCAIF